MSAFLAVFRGLVVLAALLSFHLSAFASAVQITLRFEAQINLPTAGMPSIVTGDGVFTFGLNETSRTTGLFGTDIHWGQAPGISGSTPVTEIIRAAGGSPLSMDIPGSSSIGMSIWNQPSELDLDVGFGQSATYEWNSGGTHWVSKYYMGASGWRILPPAPGGRSAESGYSSNDLIELLRYLETDSNDFAPKYIQFYEGYSLEGFNRWGDRTSIESTSWYTSSAHISRVTVQDDAPVPEPGTGLLMGLGWVTLALGTRRCRLFAPLRTKRSAAVSCDRPGRRRSR